MIAPHLFGHSSSQERLTLLSRGVRQSHRIGALLGALCQPRDLILLEGDLGAGKTALTQGIGAGLGITGTVNSPTFTLVKEYAGRLPLYHFDLYRLNDVAEVQDLGVEDYLERDGVIVVEWAERATELWPESWLRVVLHIAGPHARSLAVDAAGPRGHALLAALSARYDASVNMNRRRHKNLEEMAQ